MKNKTSFFICPGASKAGTSSLYDILKHHPELSLTNIKETRFFVNEDHHNKGKEYYLNTYFEGNKNIRGEVCPQYMSSNQTPERIYTMLGPETKIILMLRNPVDRLISHYLMKTRTFESKSLSEVLDQVLYNRKDFDVNELNAIEKHLKYTNYDLVKNNEIEALGYRYSRYIYPGLYADIIEDYLQYFPIQNIKIILFEEFVKDIDTNIKSITDFLEIDSDFEYKSDQQTNKRKIYKNSFLKRIRNLTFLIPKEYKQKLMDRMGRQKYKTFKKRMEKPFVNRAKPIISNLDKNRILEFYFPNIIRLEKLINRNLDLWKK